MWTKRFRKAATLIGTVLLAGCLGLPAQTGAKPKPLPADKQVHVFVELKSRPLAEQADMVMGLNEASYLGQLQAEQNAFRKAAQAQKINFEERFNYSRVFNGFSLKLPLADLPRLLNMPEVAAVYPVVPVEIPQVLPGDEILPDMASALEMTGAIYAHETGLSGRDIYVAIIDTGIDYTHPDLGGCTAIGPHCRVVGGWDFVGDNGYGPGNDFTPEPDDDPMDIQGHGTHVAGIVGASGSVTGVAPDVKFLAYKVFDQSSSTADIITAALEMASRDEVDVVNMSLGAAFQWPEYPTARAAENLVRRGIVVVASAGNSGADGLFSGGSPALGEAVISVASLENTTMAMKKAELGPDVAIGYGIMSFSPSPEGVGGPVAALPSSNMGCSPGDFYDAAGNSLVAGAVAMVSRGVCAFGDKALGAQAAGAVAIMIHNNAPGNFSGTLGAAGDWIPAVSISQEDANQIRSMGSVSVLFTDDVYRSPNPNAGLISGFSSWGLSPDLALKPDVAAPGGNIYSTYPMAKGGYANLSGTSMAAPQVAGLVALMLEADPMLRPREVPHLLRNTAHPVSYSHTLPFLLPTHRQGAGLVDVMAAMNAPALVQESKLSLGEVGAGQRVRQTFRITNNTNRAITYHIEHLPGLSTGFMNNPSNNSFSLYTYEAAMESTSITVQGRATRQVTVEFTAPADAPERLIFTGWVSIRPDRATRPVALVPYAGIVGDYQGLTILNRNGYEFPWLASLEDGFYVPQDRLTINPDNGEMAYLLVNLAHHARKLRIDVIAANGRSQGSAYNLEYVGRHAQPINNGTASFFSALPWDGTGRNGRPVPDGDYRLVIYALKPLGDERHADHWDTWTSPVITVRRR